MGKLINKTQGYTIVNNSILRNRELSIKERGMLITLLSLPDSWEFSIAGLSKILPDGKDAIQSAIKNLEKKGYIKRVQAKNENGLFCGYDWQINDTPEEKPLTENPSTDKPITEYQSTEKPSQLNTKELNIKKLNNNQSINLSIYNVIPKEYWRVRRDLEEMIGWDMIKEDEIAKDIFEICIEICITQEDITYIGQKKVPTSIFQSKIKGLYYEDILHIADSIRTIKQPINNIKAYILSALWNEPNTSTTKWFNRAKAEQIE